jgi:hypothetical protein
MEDSHTHYTFKNSITCHGLNVVCYPKVHVLEAWFPMWWCHSGITVRRSLVEDD